MRFRTITKLIVIFSFTYLLCHCNQSKFDSIEILSDTENDGEVAGSIEYAILLPCGMRQSES